MKRRKSWQYADKLSAVPELKDFGSKLYRICLHVSRKICVANQSQSLILAILCVLFVWIVAVKCISVWWEIFDTTGTPKCMYTWKCSGNDWTCRLFTCFFVALKPEIAAPLEKFETFCVWTKGLNHQLGAWIDHFVNNQQVLEKISYEKLTWYSQVCKLLTAELPDQTNSYQTRYQRMELWKEDSFSIKQLLMCRNISRIEKKTWEAGI